MCSTCRIGWSVFTTMAWAWKYCLTCLAKVSRANANFSSFWYRISDPYNTLLTKYTSFWSWSSSFTNAAAMSSSLIERYKKNGLSSSSLHKIGGLDRYSFKIWNACSHSVVHSNFVYFFISWKNRRAFRAKAAKNWHREVIRPIKHWTPFIELGLFISSMALHIDRLAFIPLWVSIKPRNFLALMMNVHFYGFNLILCCQRQWNTFFRLEMRFSFVVVFTSISSM